MSRLLKRAADVLPSVPNRITSPAFDAKYPLTGKNSPPILPPIESNILSNDRGEGFAEWCKFLPTDEISIGDSKSWLLYNAEFQDLALPYSCGHPPCHIATHIGPFTAVQSHPMRNGL